MPCLREVFVLLLQLARTGARANADARVGVGDRIDGHPVYVSDDEGYPFTYASFSATLPSDAKQVNAAQVPRLAFSLSTLFETVG